MDGDGSLLDRLVDRFVLYKPVFFSFIPLCQAFQWDRARFLTEGLHPDIAHSFKVIQADKASSSRRGRLCTTVPLPKRVFLLGESAVFGGGHDAGSEASSISSVLWES